MNSPTPTTEARAEYVQLMGSELGSLCHELREEIDWLQNKWMEFRHLFGAGEERIDILNTVAPNFFGFLHKLMFEDAMLHLCRLTDPPTTNRRRVRANLTVLALPHVISDPAFRKAIRARTHESLKRCEFARSVRDRRLAHTDSLVAIEGGAEHQIVSSDVQEAIASVRGVIWCVEERYGLPPSAVLQDPFGAQSLMHYLKSAVDAERGFRARLARGQFSE